MKTQLRSTRGDQGSRTVKKYQMALRHHKGSKRKTTNGTLTHVSALVCQLFFYLSGLLWFQISLQKVTEAELLAKYRTRDSTWGAFLYGKF